MNTEHAAPQPEYFIVSVLHTLARQRFITLWRPDDSGYAWPLVWAGRYPRDRVLSRLGYYNTGDTMAVPCELIERLSVPNTWPGEIDGNLGPVLLNSRANWREIQTAIIAPLTYEPRNRSKIRPYRERRRAA